MSASLVHAHEWDSGDTQRFLGLGVGRDTIFSYEYHKGNQYGNIDCVFDTEDVVRAFDYNAVNPGIMGYALNSGAAYIRELSKPVGASGNAASKGKSVLLKQRATRKCNTLAFSSAGNIVATGYERLRGSESLLLWDLNAETTSPAVNVNTSDTVLTAKFIPSIPTSLIFGGSRMLREYDTRSDSIVGSIPTNMCAKIAFNPHCDLMFATYGDSSSVAIWDRRMFGDSQPEPLLVIPRVFRESTKLDSRCLRFSLEDGNEFAVLQDGAMIRRWQLSIMRNNQGSMGTQSSQLTSGLSQHLNDQGTLSTLHSSEKSANHTSDHETEHISADKSTNNASNGNGSGTNANAAGGGNTSTTVSNLLGVTASIGAHGALNRNIRSANCIMHHHMADMDNWLLFVNKVFDVHTETDKVVSYDYASNFSTEQLDFVCLRQSGTMFRMPVTEPPSNIYLDPFNDFRMVLPPHKMMETIKDDHSQIKVSDLFSKEVRFVLDGNKKSTSSSASVQAPGTETQNIIKGEQKFRDVDQSETNNDASDISDDTSDGNHSHVDDDDSDSSQDYNGEIELKTILTNDITSTMRRRALAGYSLDAARNIELLTSNDNSGIAGNPAEPNTPSLSVSASSSSSGLLAAWKWVRQQQGIISQSRNYLETPEVDLRYIGVLNVWDGLSHKALEPRLGPYARPTSKTVDDAVKYAVRKSPGSVYVSADDDLTPYRQLCLRLSGWDFGLSELEARLVQLESEGQYEKAAGWATFHNNIERAVESLAKSRKKHLRLMSTAIAGYLVYKDVPANNVWREQCRRLASELSAPYLRAIFAFIADGSWLDVIDDGSLPLAERLGIALRFLPPKEVGKYLSLLTSRAISNGDLEAIILTGFTPKFLDLLQVYLDRTSDIQTVCLLVSFGWPRFFDDPRFPNWFAEYRQLLNSWRYFSQRARLDIARNKLVSARYSKKAVPPITGQAFLRCSHCKQMITSGPSERKEPAPGSGKRTVAMNATKSRQVWNRCPSCNHALPTCGVCATPLGPCMDDETESDRWPMFCLKCNHGYHSVHARQWFGKYDVCPEASCGCLCAKTTDTV